MLSEISARRPVLASVCSLIIVFAGVVGFLRLGIREYPAVDPPVVTVQARYAGASPDVVDSQITEVLEQALSGIAGIRTLSSTSSEGSSSIRIEFTLDTDIEAAANDVRDKVSQNIRRLPADADPPSVDKADADSDPIIFLAITSAKHDNLKLSHMADTIVKERLQTIPGVSEVRLFGEGRYAMRIYLDPGRMAAHGITPADVSSAISQQNVDLPSGRIEGRLTDISLRTDGRLLTVEDFNDLLIRNQAGRSIYLKDIGYAVLDSENLRRANISQGVPMVGLAVIPQPNTNAISIADEFFRRLPVIQADLGSDYDVIIGYDFTRFVRGSIAEVQETLVIAFLLVAGIIYVFLRSWRAVFIPVIAIPISIIAGFFIMDVAGFSINILTLLGLVLSIGLVCDDAIVVMENIYTKIELGLKPLNAAIEGTREVLFAVLATTIALAAVFTPVLFIGSLTGQLFKEFGIVIVGCVLVSAFVALTLTPMLSRFLLRPHNQEGILVRLTDPIFEGMNRLYRATLGLVLRAPIVSFPVLAVTIFATIWAFRQLPTELAPMEDRSNLRVSLRAPEGASYYMTSERARVIASEIERDYADQIHRVFAILGVPNASGAVLNIYLKEPDERTKDAFTIFNEISEQVSGDRTLRASPSLPPTIGDRRSGLPLRFVLQSTSLKRLEEVLPGFLDEARKHPALRFVDTDLKVNTPQLRIKLDRKRAADLGIPIQNVARAIQLSFGETRLGYFQRDGRQYQVIGQLEASNRREPSDLDALFVRASSGELVPLSAIARYEDTVAPASLYRYNRFLSATVSAGIAPGYTLGDGVQAMREIAERTLPPDITTDVSGQAKDLAESSSSLLYAFIGAILLVYLILAAQFESWVDPFVILLTVPLSLAGALLSLWYFEFTLNVFSQIGIIMLVGLVTKNGILLVEFANQKRAQGLTCRAAALEGAVARLRPILMTSFSTILGILPIALSAGAAAGSRQSLGVAVVGGLILSTFLTLYVVPTVYVFLTEPLRRRAEDVTESRAGGAADATEVGLTAGG